MKYFITVCLSFFCGLCAAQEFGGFNITQQQGLPSNTVYDIFQDSNGFLWIATENGIARYNGATFRTYENKLMRSRAVSGLFEDKYGRIWCNNFFGEILFVENDTLNKLESWEKFYSDGFPVITNLGDSLLIGSGKHIYYYHLLTKKWTSLEKGFSQKDQIEHLNFWDHTKSEQNTIWVSYSVGSESFVKTLNHTPAVKHRIPLDGKHLNNTVSKLLSWKGKLLLFETIHKHLFEVSEKGVTELSKEYQNILANTRQIENVSDSLLAFLSEDGLIVHTEPDQWTSMLPGKNISSIASDKEGGLWIGTLNEGLFYFPNTNSTLYPKEKFGLFPKLAMDLKNNHLFAGGYSGKISVFSSKGELLASLQPTSQKEIQSIMVDESTNQLITFSDQLHFYNLTSLKEIRREPFPAVKDIARTSNYFALATSAGLSLYHPATKKRTVIFSRQRVASVTYDPTSETLWAGTQKGLSYHHLPTHTTYIWSGDSTGYSPGATSSLITPDYLIIGTLTNGLYLLQNGNKVGHYTRAEGLCSNHITAIAFDKGIIWIGTDNGICSLDLTTKRIEPLNKTKGLVAQEVYDLLIVKDDLWVSHTLGLQHFKSLPAKNKQQPKIHINKASTNGIFFSTIYDGIRLASTSQQLTLEFDVSNNLKSRGSTKILYRIRELDGEHWNETSLQSPVANYLSLPYGSYTFEAMAQNEDGVFSINTIAVPLIVVAPFWKQGWFTSALFLVVVSIVALIIYFRFKKINEQNKLRLLHQRQEQDLRIARLTSIRAQMNPHFIFNTMSLIQGKVLNGLKDEANTSIQNFSLLLRKVLDFSGKEMIALQDEVEVLEKYLAIEKDRFDGSLDYRITLDEHVKREMIRIPSLLTQPFVENALRHGLMHKVGVKRLHVNFSLLDDALMVRIDDNGIGRKASEEFNLARKKEHRSFAVDAYQKRIELLNATRTQKIELKITDKYNEHGIANGTTVSIKVPLDYGSR